MQKLKRPQPQSQHAAGDMRQDARPARQIDINLLWEKDVGIQGEVTAGNDNDQFIQTLYGGDVVRRSGEDLSILAEVLNYSGDIGRVYFEYPGGPQNESYHPYAMNGNGGSKNYPVDYLKSAGQKTLTVTAYDASNNVIVEETLTFEIV